MKIFFSKEHQIKKVNMASYNPTSTKGWLEQWVSNVTGFSSQYGTNSWCAKKVIGQSNVYPEYGDSENTWAPQTCYANEFIEVEFEKKVFIESIKIYETYNSGGVKRILCKCDRTDSWVTLWQTDNVQHLQESRIFTPPIPRQKFSSNQLRIELDCTVANDWCEIDAVQIAGRTKFVDPPKDDALGTDLEKFINSKSYSDVTFEVEGKVIQGHKVILAARSSYFKTLFDSYRKQDRIKISDIRMESFLGLLKFFYSNSLKDINSLTLVDLIKVGEKISCEGVKQLAFYDLLDVITVSNVMDIYLSSISGTPVDLLVEVKESCLEFIGKNMKDVSKSKKFCQLPQDQMLAIIQEATDILKM